MTKIYYPKGPGMSPIVGFLHGNLEMDLKPGGTTKIEDDHVDHVLMVFPFLKVVGKDVEESEEEDSEDVESDKELEEEVEEKGKKKDKKKIDILSK